MQDHRLMQSSLCVLVVSLLVGGSGCDEFTRWSPMNAQFERTIAQRIPLDGSDTLDVLTQFGSVVVAGTDAADCNVVARIVARAPTEEEAQELAEQVEILGRPEGSTLKIRSREPDLANNRSISVSYTISVPRRMNVKCDSGYGSLDLSDIEGRLDGRSGNGSIKARNIQGPTDLNSSYGSIECRKVTGQSITLRSDNGAIAAAELRGPVTAETAYGRITCEDFSDGDLRLKSGNGSIEITGASFGVCEARSSYGSIAARNIKGESVELRSDNGRVEVTDVRTKKLDASSSYGSIVAAGVVAANLTARSGNGSVDIACAADAPAGLIALARSSYGRVEFTAPPAFAGEVHLSTGYGSIRTALPVTTSGGLSKQKMDGRIGQGTGNIRLESDNGSVELK